MKSQLIINIDDGFYAEVRDQGIVQCLSSLGNTSSDVSVLVNGVVANSILNNQTTNSCLYNYIKKFCIVPGLHLNLTEGKSIRNSTYIQSFLDFNGCFLGKHGIRNKFIKNGHHLFKLDQIERELIAQLDRFQQLFGIFPSHLDGHQHVHVLPGIREVVSRVIPRYGIKWIRLPNEIMPSYENLFTELSKDEYTFYKEVSDQAFDAKILFASSSIKFTDGFMGMLLMGQNQNMESVKLNLNLLTHHQLIEFMTHPGLSIKPTILNVANPIMGCGQPDGPDAFSQSPDRQWELQFLSSDLFKRYLRAHDYTLTRFMDLI